MSTLRRKGKGRYWHNVGVKIYDGLIDGFAQKKSFGSKNQMLPRGEVASPSFDFCGPDKVDDAGDAAHDEDSI